MTGPAAAAYVAHALMRAASTLMSTPAPRPYRAVTTGSGFRKEPA
jgi:hypothetical protein